MRVLYLVRYADALSESYIRAEADFAMESGVDVVFCATDSAIDTYPVDAERVRRDGNLAKAVETWKPDVIHVHWLNIAAQYQETLERIDIPVTVRSHSFDVNREALKHVSRMPSVRKIWIFPNLHERHLGVPKLEPLNVAFNARFFSPAPDKNKTLVVRVGAGLPGKGIEQFLEIAALRPEFQFVLAMTEAAGERGYAEKIWKVKPENLIVLEGLQHERVAALMQDAGIYVRGYDPNSHDFGMPVSIAEAMASGCFVLAADANGAKDYLGLAGGTFRSADEAARMISETAKMSDEWWAMQQEASLLMAERYTPSRVLPAVVGYWKHLAEAKK